MARPRHMLKPGILLNLSSLSLLSPEGLGPTSPSSDSLHPPRPILPPNVYPWSPFHFIPTLLWSSRPRDHRKVRTLGSEGLRTATVPRSALRYYVIPGKLGPSPGLCFGLAKGQGGGGLWLPPPAVPRGPPDLRIWEPSLPLVPLNAIQFKRNEPLGKRDLISS